MNNKELIKEYRERMNNIISLWELSPNKDKKAIVYGLNIALDTLDNMIIENALNEKRSKIPGVSYLVSVSYTDDEHETYVYKNKNKAEEFLKICKENKEVECSFIEEVENYEPSCNDWVRE